MAKSKQQPVVKAAPSPVPKAASSSPPAPPPSPLPIAHYIPRLPLQLIALLFACFASSSTVIKDQSIVGPARLVAALTQDPLAVLPLICGLAAIVQTWFGHWARSCRNDALKARKAAKDGEKTAEAAPVKESLGFKGSFGAMWDRAMKGEAPHQTMWKKARSKKSAGEAMGGFDTRFVPQAAMVTFGGALVFHAISVLLGAPHFSNFTETFLNALLLSVLAVLPLSIAIPPLSSLPERYTWLRLFSSISADDDLEFALLAPAVGAILGSWCGAIPIPLDWDRPWQKYPTTLVLGSLLGHAAGSLVSLAVTGYRAAVRGAADVLREVEEKEREKREVERRSVQKVAGRRR
ncbi:hypothetical protein JCM8097_001863 [Rhodosporidiobolus ruineniae]